MPEEEYELLPHQLLSDLKFDVEALKKKLTQPDTKMGELILEIESLKDSIHELTVIFQKTLEETKEEDPSVVLRTVQEKLDSVVRQNETIAKGMIAISDKLENFMESQTGRPMPSPLSAGGSPAKHIMGTPAMPGPPRMAPPPSMPADLPPPPPRKKRTGLFK